MTDRRGVIPDDERSTSPGLYVLVGLASLVLAALALAFLVIPPALAAHLAIRGSRSARPLLSLAGFALFAAWFVALVLAGSRIMSARTPPPPSAPPP